MTDPSLLNDVVSGENFENVSTRILAKHFRCPHNSLKRAKHVK